MEQGTRGRFYMYVYSRVFTCLFTCGAINLSETGTVMVALRVFT